MKILVVEDNAVVGTDLVFMLREWGYEADGPHASVEDALAAVDRFNPNAALLDIDLQNGSSSEPVADLLTKLGIPFLCLTGFSSSSQKSFPALVDAPNVEKPIRPDKLRSLLEALLRSANRG